MVNRKKDASAKAVKSSKETVEKPDADSHGDVVTATRSSGRRAKRGKPEQASQVTPKRRKSVKENFNNDIREGELVLEGEPKGSQNECRTPSAESASQDAVDLDIPAHRSKVMQVISKDGRSTNITFKEENNYVDMEVTGDLTSDESSVMDTEVTNSSNNTLSHGEEVYSTSSSDSEESEVYSESGHEKGSLTKRKHRGKTKAKDRKKKAREEAMMKVRHYMIRKGLIDHDMSESEIENLVGNGELSDGDDFPDSPVHKKKKVRRKEKMKRSPRRDSQGKNKDSQEQVIINSPSETTIYRNVVPFEESDDDQEVILRSTTDERLPDDSICFDNTNGDNIEYISDRDTTHRSACRKKKHRHSRSRTCMRSRSRS